ncbi:hypothetical protein MTR67_040104 [Solanum verrucosum]|uniref:DUF4283 domain-containing protein n=1 Tax=Solanum verrucosum TaxID=315347 RepID=A0AAF0UIY6_SOLVR|nr:hypothetical protein MTR67_040104 [Solanum verrucosum]
MVDPTSSSHAPLAQFPHLPNQNTTPMSHDNANPLNYKLLLKNKLSKDITPIEIKAVEFVDGEPVVRWLEAEVTRMNIIENLQYAVVGKFSYGWPNMDELRNLIPQQCGTKEDFQIGYLQTDTF